MRSRGDPPGRPYSDNDTLKSAFSHIFDAHPLVPCPQRLSIISKSYNLRLLRPDSESGLAMTRGTSLRGAQRRSNPRFSALQMFDNLS